MSRAFTKPFTHSRYAKEELPVWSEIWEQFALNRAYDYDPDNPAHNLPAPDSSQPEVILNSHDIYWQQPHRKLLLGWMANEFNKLILEDGRLNEIREELNGIILANLDMIPLDPTSDLNVIDIIFDIVGVHEAGPAEFYRWIYTQLSPTTKTRSIFASSEPSVDMANLNDWIELAMELIIDLNGDTVRVKLRPTVDDTLYTLIVDKILEPIRIYFDEPVGWKDEGYELQPLTRRCLDMGIDPAI